MTLFESDRLHNVAVALLILFVGAAGLLYFANYMLWSFGLSPGDGGVLRPFAERALWATVIALSGIALLWGALLYMYRYVLSIERDGDRLWVATLGVTGRHRVSFMSGELCRGSFHKGRFEHYPGVSVDAPYLTLHARGHRVPYILDLQAGHINRKAVNGLRCNY